MDDIHGYDETFLIPLDIDHTCPICLMGLKEPLQTPCGHRFCKNCIIKMIRENAIRCPMCQLSIMEKELVPDNFAKREILSFIVKCRITECEWTGPLKTIEQHMTECPLFTIDCPNNCKEFIKRRDCEEHLNNSCSNRKIRCVYCCEFLTVNQEIKHIDLCPKLPIICPHCSESVIREALTNDHLCPNLKTRCPFAFIGCSFENFAVMEHIAEKSSQHLATLAKFTQRLATEGTNVICQNHKRTKFKWIITDISNCWHAAEFSGVHDLNSFPFYASGYKMCVRISWNCVNARKISIFIHMMKGEQDDSLKWPFQGTFTISILDQTENTCKREPVTEQFITRPDLEPFFKPTAVKTTKGFGYSNFCDVDTVKRLTKNNTLLIQVLVSC